MSQYIIILRSLEKLDKQLTDWLAKEPINREEVSPGGTKRKCRDNVDGEISSVEVDASNAKRQLMYSELNNENENEAEDLQLKSDDISNKDIIAEKESEITNEPLFANENNKDASKDVAEANSITGKETCEPLYSPKQDEKTKSGNEMNTRLIEVNSEHVSLSQDEEEEIAENILTAQDMNVRPISSISLNSWETKSTEGGGENDDIFSDVSGGMKFKLAKMNALDLNSTDDSDEEDIIGLSGKCITEKLEATTARSINSSSSSIIPNSTTSDRSSLSSLTSSLTLRSSRSSRVEPEDLEHANETKDNARSEENIIKNRKRNKAKVTIGSNESSSNNSPVQKKKPGRPSKKEEIQGQVDEKLNTRPTR